MKDGARVVRRIGWLHFLNDFTLDFLTPLLPAGVGAAWVGLMEGIADGLGQVLKLATGRASDRDGRRVPWVRAGYLVNACARPLAGVGMLLALPWWIVACRVADRVGKGLRGSAVDALIADWTSDGERAAAYARMRVMDHLGAALGGLAAAAVAFWLLPWLGWVVVGLVAATVAVAWLCRGLQDAPRTEQPANTSPPGWWPRTPELRRPLAAIAIASLGAKLSPLLVLIAVAGVGTETSWPLWAVCLGWAAFGLIQAGAAALAGAWTQAFGPALFLRLGWLAGAGVFAALACGLTGAWLIAAGCAYGVLSGLTEGAEKTWLASLAPKHERATAFGSLALVGAVAGLVGNAACGWFLAVHGPLVFAGLALALGVGALATLGARR